MSLFEPSSIGIDESDLERVLQGIPFTKYLTAPFDGIKKDRRKTDSPIYLLPVNSYDEVVVGYCKIDEDLNEIPIGFLHKQMFVKDNYYLLNTDGSLQITEPLREEDDTENYITDIIYLPLKLTHLITNLIQKGRWYNTDQIGAGSPFKVLGIEGCNGVYPLVLVSDTEEGLRYKGFFKTLDGKVSTYDYDNLRVQDKEIKAFLRKVKGIDEIQKRTTIPAVTISPPSAETTPALPTPIGKPYVKRLSTTNEFGINWREPKSIVKYLDQYIIGQEEAKKEAAIAFSNYIIRMQEGDEDLPKDNLLLIGPSGVGKSLIISQLAKRANIPIIQTKLTGKSTEGYKGENLSVIFEQLHEKTKNHNPYAIIFLDELDKLTREDGGNGFGSKLQDELIGYLEDADITIDLDRRRSETATINTKNILFVTAGAFQGTKGNSLQDIIAKRIGSHKKIGFGGMDESTNKQNISTLLQYTRPEDLINYGLKPELIGRLPAIAILNSLSLEDKTRILTKARGSPLQKYLRLMERKGYRVHVEEKSMEVIANLCPAETGARALASICNNLFRPIIFEPEKYTNARNEIFITPTLTTNLISLYRDVELKEKA